MTTQYTTILKLALPVQGELSGSWGDVVNDNITEMVEEAVAGLATINSWTANSHTLTTANGTTSESRCAVLVADDDGAGNPSAAATIICPSATKLYVLKNISGQQVTLKTAAGTGVAVPNGSAAFLFCDGTNVEACQTDIIDATTIDTTNLEVTNIKAKDGTASGSIANSTGVFTINSAVLTTADINGGTIDGAVIGGSSAAAGTFTTFTSTGIDDNASSTAITIDSSQNVGIGTASPAHELDVLGASDPIIRVRATGSGTSDDSLIRMAVTNASASNYIQFGDTSDADVGYIRYAHSTNSLYFATNAAVGMTIDSSQNVGIGTASPASALTVSDGTVSSLTPFGGTELFLDSIGSNYLQFGSGTSSSPAIYFGDSADGDVGGIIYAHASNAMSFRTNGSESMRIDTSGKLIVNGTTGMGMLNAYASNWPENALAIYSANVAGQTNYAGIAFNNQDTDAAVGNVADIYTNPTGTLSLTSGANPAIQLKYGSGGISGGTPALTVNSSGQVLIGSTTASGDGALHVSGNNAEDVQITMASVGNTNNQWGIGRDGNLDGRFVIADTSDNWSTSTERLSISTTTGNVGIGTSSPGSSRLAVLNGGAQAVLSVRDSANGRVQIGTTDYSVSNSSAADLQISNQALSGTVGMTFNVGDATNSGNIYWRSNTTNNAVQIVGNPGNNYLAFATSSAEKMRIDSSGNVGIGTSSPVKKLHVDGPALATIGTLTDGATITPDFDANQNFSVTLGGNRTLANPSNIDAGQTGSIFVTQDGTGSRTLSFGSYWDFAGGTAPTLSTAAGAVDRIDYIVRTGTSIHAVATLNLS